MDHLDYWLQIVFTVAPVVALGGILYEKVRQIEKRLDGNGDSVPGRCKVHELRLDEFSRRLRATQKKMDEYFRVPGGK